MWIQSSQPHRLYCFDHYSDCIILDCYTDTSCCCELRGFAFEPLVLKWTVILAFSDQHVIPSGRGTSWCMLFFWWHMNYVSVWSNCKHFMVRKYQYNKPFTSMRYCMPIVALGDWLYLDHRYTVYLLPHRYCWYGDHGKMMLLPLE